jgi:hypothetical protein
MMDDGGPAFPLLLREGEYYQGNTDGMSLRDYFAAKAMAALAGQEHEADAAHTAYVIADAMIAERAKVRP